MNAPAPDISGLSEQQQTMYAIYLSQDVDVWTAYLLATESAPVTGGRSSSTPVPRPSPQPTRISLKTPKLAQVLQEEKGWCFAATALGLAKYLGKPTVPIWKLVAMVNGQPTLDEKSVRAQYGDNYGLEERALEALGVTVARLPGLNLNNILDALRSDRPVILAWGSHSRVVVGYDPSSDQLLAWDPQHNEVQNLDVGIIDDSETEVYIPLV